ncbi:MAG: L-serine ammonia-lyase [Candidatus Endonucleobacter bathymodioli]|uniref:L-serine dehydratase n=1 Tax=Candidatus Endonucleibacter bathymodioli TaxID=539814 RepID=A0AA90NJI2_9GAMM|nr:L-serine ammonia-lyase [Candidatus Endonucleobacter bathymodioli]
MGLSIFDLFKIGIGPSSSHTVGPMIAANRFLDELKQKLLLKKTTCVKVDLFGSLALTGLGHATDTAIILGLLGKEPHTINPDDVPLLIEKNRQSNQLKLADSHNIIFVKDQHLIFHYDRSLQKHPNGITFEAKDENDKILYQNNYYSVGGGFVISEDETNQAPGSCAKKQIPYPFESAQDLLDIGDKTGLTIANIILANELALNGNRAIDDDLMIIWQAMDNCIHRGCRETGTLPGGLNVKRRAQNIHQTLSMDNTLTPTGNIEIMDWVSLFALAVSEENAAGSRVVTAPTNGAAGVIPAVLTYYHRFVEHSNEQGIRTFLITAAAIGMLYKKNASISAAEVGCQGEIGVACSMAAGALCAVLNGSNRQIENAAEIGMEHNLGLTCDPIGGLVQIPCIERNALGSIKAITAARLALKGDGEHRVSLDEVIATMLQTGIDMQNKYKETALGGLAANVVMC